MKQTKKQITKTLKELRKLLEDKNTDTITSRVAQAMETAIIWATEDTDWDMSMSEEAKLLAEFAREEWAEEIGHYAITIPLKEYLRNKK